MHNPNTLPLWRAGIFEFESQCSYANPFLDVQIWAEFTAPSGRIIRREAYWDGANTYKVSFAPAEPGIWQARLEAPGETGLDGTAWTVEAVPYEGNLAIYQHGFLRVADNGHFLCYADGTPFFWLGDTHWEFAYRERWDESNHPGMDSMFRGMADRRVRQGYTVYQTNLRSDRAMGGNGLYWDETSATDLPNLSFYQRELDRRMQYLADLGLVNALGQAWFMSIDGDLQHQKNLARYLVARYGALPMVWTLAGETAGYEPGEARRRIDGWREVALLIQKLDGYGQLQTAHYTNERPFAEYYQDEDWFDFALNQSGHGDYPIGLDDYVSYCQKHKKPFIEGEALYEFCSTLEELGTRICTPDMLRRVAYMSIQAGGCGYTYGAQGIWDVVWEKGRPNPMALFNRFDITWAEAIDGPGGEQMGYMRRFYEKAHFWELRPYGAQAEEKSFSPFAKKQPYVTISPDAARMVLYYADSTRKPITLQGLKDLPYQGEWFNPRTGETQACKEQILPREGCWTSPAKPGEKDWLLLVTLSSQ